LAIYALKALIFAKNLAIWLGTRLQRPFSAFFSRFFVPIFAWVYKMYRLARLAAWDALALFRGQATRFLTGRHALQAAAILLAILVADTNIRASSLTAVDTGNLEDKSVLEVLTDQTYSDEADTLVEDMVTDEAPPAVDMGYLDDEAAVREAMPVIDDNIGADDEEASLDETVIPDPFLTAIQDQSDVPGGAGQASSSMVGARARIVQYVVEEGDTVAAIADKFHLKPATLIAVNGLSSRAIIRDGMTLRVPPVDGVVYVVKRGDTVGSIGRRLSAVPQDIINANGLGGDGNITIGMELIVPGGKLPVPVTPQRSTTSRVPSQLTKYAVPDDADDSGVSAGKFIWPAGVRRISQYYKGSRHTGVDIAGPVGTPLYASAGGTIISAGWNSGGYGYMTIIDHGNGYFTRYGHQSKILVSVGDSVRRGQVIGLMGSTGRSTGPHLHFEVMRGSLRNRLNPLAFVK
jgi:murein DD-endopeptidase MepM/ murein hydrolase activator NlpD